MSSAGTVGARLEPPVAAAHRNLQLRDMFYGDIGRAALGEPQRVPGR